MDGAGKPAPLERVKEMALKKSIREQLRSARPDMVQITLPLEKSKPSTLLVSVNGLRYSIQRGKKVSVPWAVAKVIEQSEQSDLALSQRLEEMARNPYMTIR